MLSKDISLKIISVFVAILLWLFVYNNNNPLKDYKVNVALKVINEDSLREKGIVLKSYQQYIEVNIRGRSEDIKNVSASDFEAYLDFAKIKSDNVETISIDKPIYKGGGQIYDYTRTVNVDIEKYETKGFPVEVTTTGKLKNGYKVINLSYLPQKIQIEGLESVIKSVGKIKAEIDVTNLDRDIVNRKYGCKVYDKNGKIMSQLSRDLTVEVSIEVGKEVPITIITKGKLAVDFIEVSRSITPQLVVVSGSASLISKLTELRIEPINISNIKSDLKTNSTIKLPEGVNLVDASKEVEVTIVLEKLISKDISILRETIQILNIAPPDKFTYEIIKPEAAIVNLKGRKADLDNLGIETLKPTIDVVDLKQGLQKVPLNLKLPSGVILTQNVFIEVKISQTPVPVQP